MNIIGHQKIISFFKQAKESGNLSHAYIFVGAKNIGKETVVRKIAADLFGVHEEKLDLHPDWFKIGPMVDEKTGKRKKDISIEQLRECQKFLMEFSFFGGYKITIIKPAEYMSLAAANSLLKILEESGKKNIIFLLAINEDKVPVTIRSRCQTIYFTPVDSAEIILFLNNKNISNQEAEEIACLSAGLPGRVIAWVENKELFFDYKKELQRFHSLFKLPFYAKLSLVENLFGDKTDHIVARESLMAVLEIWQIALRGKVTDASTVNIYNQIQLARERLRENIHPRLLVEQILLAIP